MLNRQEMTEQDTDKDKVESKDIQKEPEKPQEPQYWICKRRESLSEGFICNTKNPIEETYCKDCNGSRYW